MRVFEIWIRYYDADNCTVHMEHERTRGNDVNDAMQVYLLIMRTREGAMIPKAAGFSVDMVEVRER